VVGAPFLNGITLVEAVADALLVVCTMICVALMVVPLVVPRTRTGSPFVMAVAEIEVVPLWYFVDDASLTVTF
jgi:hypothetical protein